MKKEYTEPKMEIVNLKQQSSLLCESEGVYCDELGFDTSKTMDSQA